MAPAGADARGRMCRGSPAKGTGSGAARVTNFTQRARGARNICMYFLIDPFYKYVIEYLILIKSSKQDLITKLIIHMDYKSQEKYIKLNFEEKYVRLAGG
jgi:hypothetical protein